MKRTEEILKAAIPFKLLSFLIIKFSKFFQFLFLIIAFAFVIVRHHFKHHFKQKLYKLLINKRMRKYCSNFTKFDITYN
jgi:hypothetical protein